MQQPKAERRSVIQNRGQVNHGDRLPVVREAAIDHGQEVWHDKELARNALRSPTYPTRDRTLSL